MQQWVTRVVTVGSTAEWMACLDETTLPFEPSQDPTVLDRSRKVHPAPIARKPAPMLDLIKVSVVLTVQVGLRAAAPSVAKGLPAPFVFEWE
jgi:hypothetical protein